MHCSDYGTHHATHNIWHLWFKVNWALNIIIGNGRFEFALASVMWSLDWGKATRVPNTSITINWHRFKLHVNLHFNFAQMSRVTHRYRQTLNKKTYKQTHRDTGTHKQQEFKIHLLQSTQSIGTCSNSLHLISLKRKLGLDTDKPIIRRQKNKQDMPIDSDTQKSHKDSIHLY